MDISYPHSGIYRIYNSISDKSYIGQSQDVYERWKQHQSTLKHNTCHNQHLQAAWNLYGEDAFYFELIEFCPVSDLDDREIFWISFYNAYVDGYNQTLGGAGHRGYRISEDTRQKLKSVKRTPEQCAEMSRRHKEWHLTHTNPRSKAVVCLNTGEWFANAVLAAKHFGLACGSSNIGRCCSGEIAYSGEHNGEKLIWVREDDYNAMSKEERDDRLEYVRSGMSRTKNLFRHKIVCVTTGEHYNSIADAAKQYGLNAANIGGCCKHQHKYCGLTQDNRPLIWMYENEYVLLSQDHIAEIIRTTKPYSETRGSASKKSVLCLTTDRVFSSIKDAAKEYELNARSLSSALCNHREYFGKNPETGERLRWAFAT